MLAEPVLACEPNEVDFPGHGLQAGELLVSKVLVERLGENLVALGYRSVLIEVGDRE
jgi:hypothetical protein